MEHVIIAGRRVALAEITGIFDIANYPEPIGPGDSVAALAEVPGLYRISLRGASELVDIGPLSSQTVLQILDLADTGVRDLTPLEGMSSLHTLDLRGAPIVDMSPLARLESLWLVRVHEDQLASPGIVEQLQALAELGRRIEVTCDEPRGEGATDWAQVLEVSPVSPEDAAKGLDAIPWKTIEQVVGVEYAARARWQLNQVSDRLQRRSVQYWVADCAEHADLLMAQLGFQSESRAATATKAWLDGALDFQEFVWARESGSSALFWGNDTEVGGASLGAAFSVAAPYAERPIDESNAEWILNQRFYRDAMINAISEIGCCLESELVPEAVQESACRWRGRQLLLRAVLAGGASPGTEPQDPIPVLGQSLLESPGAEWLRSMPVTRCKWWWQQEPCELERYQRPLRLTQYLQVDPDMALLVDAQHRLEGVGWLSSEAALPLPFGIEWKPYDDDALEVRFGKSVVFVDDLEKYPHETGSAVCWTSTYWMAEGCAIRVREHDDEYPRYSLWIVPSSAVPESD
jgi:hypothetical protein